MALLTDKQANLLTAPGFYDKYMEYRGLGWKREEAYDEAEKDHEAITGRRRYEDFESFEVVARRFNKREVAQIPPIQQRLR